MRIQVPIDSRNSAIQHAYHTLLHPSSSSQPRHPMLKIVVTHKGLRPWKQERIHWVSKAQRCPGIAAGRQRKPTWLWLTSLNVHGGEHSIAAHLPTQAFTAPNHCAPVQNGCANDPSAGSPTETLLRLLLPLSDKVH